VVGMVAESERSKSAKEEVVQEVVR